MRAASTPVSAMQAAPRRAGARIDLGIAVYWHSWLLAVDGCPGHLAGAADHRRSRLYRDTSVLESSALPSYPGVTSVWPLVQTLRAGWNTMRADWGRMTDADALTIKTVHDGRICALTLSGTLDFATAAEFLERVAEAVDDRTERFVLDLAGLGFVDCDGARALVMAKYAVPDSCPVIIRSISPPVAGLLDLLSLNLWHPWRELSEALEHHGTPVQQAQPAGPTALSDH